MGDSSRRFWCWILNNLPLADCLIASYTSKSEKLYVWRTNILCDCALLGLGTATCKLAFPFLSIALCQRQMISALTCSERHCCIGPTRTSRMQAHQTELRSTCNVTMRWTSREHVKTEASADDRTVEVKIELQSEGWDLMRAPPRG